MDLAAWWKARRWVALLDLIDQLPATSRLHAALRNNPAMAEWVATQEDPTEEGPAWSPPLTEWDVHAEILAQVRDRLGAVANGIAALGGAKPRKDKMFPRPVTEIDRARARAEYRAYLQGLAVFSPHALHNN